MVTITIEGAKVILEVEGLDKLWSFRSRLTIPLAHIRGVRAEPEAGRRWFHGIKVAGTNVPGFLAAGTFYHEGGLVFWDVHDPDKAIAIDLSDERYQRLIVEVADPPAAIQLLTQHLSRRNA